MCDTMAQREGGLRGDKILSKSTWIIGYKIAARLPDLPNFVLNNFRRRNTHASIKTDLRGLCGFFFISDIF